MFYLHIISWLFPNINKTVDGHSDFPSSFNISHNSLQWKVILINILLFKQGKLAWCQKSMICSITQQHLCLWTGLFWMYPEKVTLPSTDNLNQWTVNKFARTKIMNSLSEISTDFGVSNAVNYIVLAEIPAISNIF